MKKGLRGEKNVLAYYEEQHQEHLTRIKNLSRLLKPLQTIAGHPLMQHVFVSIPEITVTSEMFVSFVMDKKAFPDQNCKRNLTSDCLGEERLEKLNNLFRRLGSMKDSVAFLGIERCSDLEESPTPVVLHTSGCVWAYDLLKIVAQLQVEHGVIMVPKEVLDKAEVADD